MNLAACFLHVNKMQIRMVQERDQCKFSKARANTLNLYRKGAACRVFLFTLVGFIDWLDVFIELRVSLASYQML